MNHMATASWLDVQCQLWAMMSLILILLDVLDGQITDTIALKTNKWVLDKIGNSLVLRSQMMERKLKFFGHVISDET